MSVHDIAYVDVQHDTLTVIDDVEQGVVVSEDFWISGYKRGSSSVHGKVKVTPAEGGGSELTARDGIKLARDGKTAFRVSIPQLDISDMPCRFARQVISPPYQKASALTPPLTINSIACSPQRQRLVVAGPDGYLCLLSTRPGAQQEKPVLLNGHVGDVLDVRFFPSGEVILSSSSDLSLRVFGLDGSNPRTLKGHTRAVTSTAVIGVGKQVVSGSRDGTVRLWNVGGGKEVRKWFINPPRAVEAVFIDTQTDSIMAVRQDGVVQVFALPENSSTGGAPTEKAQDHTFITRSESALVCAAWDQERRILATGHADGVVQLQRIPNAPPPGDEPAGRAAAYMFRRNESAVYSLHFTPEGDLYFGTAAGLPCRLSVQPPGPNTDDKWSVAVLEELAGWDATGVEAWCSTDDGVWCAGAEASVRRY